MILFLTDEHKIEVEPVIWYDNDGYGFCTCKGIKIRFAVEDVSGRSFFDPFDVGVISIQEQQCQVCDEPMKNTSDGNHICWQLSNN